MTTTMRAPQGTKTIASHKTMTNDQMIRSESKSLNSEGLSAPTPAPAPAPALAPAPAPALP